jgi:hypothetical protein
MSCLDIESKSSCVEIPTRDDTIKSFDYPNQMLNAWGLSRNDYHIISTLGYRISSHIKRSLLNYRYLKGWGSIFIDIHINAKKRKLKRIHNIYNINFASILSHSSIWKYIVMPYLYTLN